MALMKGFLKHQDSNTNIDKEQWERFIRVQCDNIDSIMQTAETLAVDSNVEIDITIRPGEVFLSKCYRGDPGNCYIRKSRMTDLNTTPIQDIINEASNQAVTESFQNISKQCTPEGYVDNDVIQKPLKSTTIVFDRNNAVVEKN